MKYRWRVYVTFLDEHGIQFSRSREVSAATESEAIHEAIKSIRRFFPKAEKIETGRAWCLDTERRRVWNAVVRIEKEKSS